MCHSWTPNTIEGLAEHGRSCYSAREQGPCGVRAAMRTEQAPGLDSDLGIGRTEALHLSPG